MNFKTKITAAVLTIALAGGIGITAVYANSNNNRVVTRENHPIAQHLGDSNFDLSGFSLHDINLEDFDFEAVRDLIVERKNNLLALSNDEIRDMVAGHLATAQGLFANLEGLDLAELRRGDFSHEEARELLAGLLPEGFDMSRMHGRTHRAR